MLPIEFYRRENWLAAFLLVLNVAIVGGTGILAYHVGSLAGLIAAYVLVGARCQACYILQHEAMHNLLFANRPTNDWIGTALSAFLGTQFYFGRALHMKHHREVGADSDPNEFLHTTRGKEPKWRFVGFVLFQLFGGRLALLMLSLSKSILDAAGLRKLGAQIKTPNTSIDVNVPSRYRQIDLLALLAVQNLHVLRLYLGLRLVGILRALCSAVGYPDRFFRSDQIIF